MTLGTQSPVYGKLLDYEQFIDHQLTRTRRRIKNVDIFTAALTLLVGFLTVLLVEVILDHVVGLPLVVRQLVLFVGLLTAAVFAALRLVLPFLHRVNAIYAAKTIEDADAAFKNSLINYLELRRQREQISKAVLATLEARAVTDLAQVEVDSVVNQQRLTKVFYTFSGVIVVFCLYAAFAPKSSLDSARRAFLSDLVRPTNTQLKNIKPGNEKVVAGSNVPFSVYVDGVRPSRVLLHYSVDGGKFFAVREFAPGRHMYDPWQLALPSVQQTMDYFLTGGDAESLRYRLEVLPAPTVSSVAVDLDFPPYTKVPRRANIEGGNVEAIEGTRVTVHATTNMPAQMASMNITSSDQVAPMEVSSEGGTDLTGQFNVTKTGTYTINFRTQGGQLNPNPVVYDIVAIPDRAPTARFVQPDRPDIKVPANVKVNLAMVGSDDHGVKDATLHVRLGNNKLVSKNMLEGVAPQPEFKAKEILDLAQHRVKPGSKLEYWLTVRDNKEPTSNPYETAKQVIEVIEPVSDAEKKQQEDKQKKDMEQLDQAASAQQDQEPPAEKTSEESSNKSGEASGDSGGGAGTEKGAQAGNDGSSKSGTQDKGEDGKEGTSGAGRGEGAQNDQSEPTPEQRKKLEEVMKDSGLLPPQAKNANNPSGNQTPPPGNAGAPDSARASGSPNPLGGNAKGTSADRTQRPQMRDSGSPGSPDRPPPQGQSPSSDASNEVSRADRQGPSSSTPPGPKGSNESNASSERRDRSEPSAPPDQSKPPGTKEPAPTPPGPKESNDSKSSSERRDQSEPSARPDQRKPAGAQETARQSPDSKSAQSPKDENSGGTQKPGDQADNRARPKSPENSTPRDPRNEVPPDARRRESYDPRDPHSKQGGNQGSAGDSSKSQAGSEEGARSNGEAGAQPESARDRQDGSSSPQAKGQRPSGTRPDSDRNAAEKTPNRQSSTEPGKGEPGTPDRTGEQPAGRPGDEKSGVNPSDRAQSKGQSDGKGAPGSKDTRRSGDAAKDAGARDSSNPDQRAGEPKPGTGSDSSTKPQSGRPGEKGARPGGEPGGKEADSKEGSGADERAGQTGPRSPNQKAGATETSLAKGEESGPPGAKDTQNAASRKQAARRMAQGRDAKIAEEEEKEKARDYGKLPDPNAKKQKNAPDRAVARKGAMRPDDQAELNQPKDEAAKKAEGQPPKQTDANARDRAKSEQAAGEKAQNRDAADDTMRDPRKEVPPDPRHRESFDPRDAHSRNPDQKSATNQPDNQRRDRNPDDRHQQPRAPQTGDRNERQDDNPPSNSRTDQTQDESRKEQGESSRNTERRDRENAERKRMDRDAPRTDRSMPEQDRQPQPPSPPRSEFPKEQTPQDHRSNMPHEQSQSPGGMPKRDQTDQPPPQNPQQQSREQEQRKSQESSESSKDRTPQDSKSNTPHEESHSKGSMAKRGSSNEPDDQKQSRNDQQPQSKSATNTRAQSESAQNAGSEQGESGTGKTSGSKRAGGKGNQPGETAAESGSSSTKGAGASEKRGTEGSAAAEGGTPKSGGQERAESSGSAAQGEKQQSSGGSPSESRSARESSSAGSEKSQNQEGAQSQAGNSSGSSSSQPGKPNGGMNKNSPNMGGGGGRSQMGGGGGPGPGANGREKPDDETKESPRAKEVDNQFAGDNVAPAGQPQSDLTLRKLPDLLNDPNAVKKLEDAGITRSQIEQWTTNYKKKASAAAARPGTELKLRPGEQTKAQPTANLPTLDPKMNFNSKNVRGKGTMPQDTVRGNLEGIRLEPPREFKSKWEAYKDKIGKAVAPTRVLKPAPKP
jgi:hypothetical protein